MTVQAISLSTDSPQGFWNLRLIFCFLAGCVAMTALGAIVLIFFYGSIDVAIARLQGNEVILADARADIGELSVRSTEVATHFTVRNLTAHAIKLTGCHVDCECVRVGSLPLTLGPATDTNIDVAVEVPAAPSPISHNVVFYTDSNANPQLAGVVSGSVKE